MPSSLFTATTAATAAATTGVADRLTIVH